MSKFSDSTFYLAPSGYRETILFPQKPLSSIGHLSVGRASSATRTNPAGQVEEVCYNLLQYSEDFNNAIWQKTATTISANTTTAPNGTTTADTLIEDTSSSTHRIFNNSAVTVSTSIATTYSVYLKSAGRTRAWVRDNDLLGALFNLSTGTIVSTDGGVTASITNVGNDWYRCVITKVSTTTNGRIAVYLDNGTSDSYTGNGTSGIFLWGAQLVQGNLPKDYLYTSDRLNFPRVDYSDGSASFLLEPQRTNLCLYSQTFSDTSWTALNSTKVSTTNIDPGNTTTALNVTWDSGGSKYFYRTQTGLTIGTTYTITFYAKSSNGSKFRIYGESLGVVSANFTTTSDFQRFQLTYTATVISGTFGLQSASDNTAADLIVAFAQFEAGSYPTTYIPTTSSTATRLADTFTRNNIYTNNLISSSGGTWFIELKNNFALVRDNLNESILLGVTNCLGLKTFSGTSRIALIKLIGGSQTTLYTTTNDNTKIVFKWNGTTVDAFVDGVKQVSGSAFAITVMELFNTSIQTPYYIKQMALWNTPLSDSQCIELTGVAYTTPSQAYGSLNLVSESPDCLYTSVNTINRI